MRKILFILLGAICFAFPAVAANKYQVVASVANQAITNLDIINRIKITIISSGLDGSPEVVERIKPQALQNLINEKLQLTESARLGQVVKEEEIDGAIAVIEKRNGMPEGSVQKLLGANGVPPSALRDQLRAELAWAQIQNFILRKKVNISDEEAETLVHSQNISSSVAEYNLSEIVLAVELPEDDSKIAALAANLKSELDAGKDFTKLAAQFSQSGTSKEGGNLGWMSENQVPPEIMAGLAGLQAGQTTAPIRSIEGYFIVKLNGARRSETNLGKSVVNVKQYLSLDEPKLEALTDFSNACVAPADFAKANGVDFKEFTNTRVRDLPTEIGGFVSRLAAGAVSNPVKIDEAYSLFVICGKEEAPDVITAAELQKAKEQIFRRKIELESRKYMRDLRRNTNIEIIG